MVRRSLSYNVIQLVDVVYSNYKTYQSGYDPDHQVNNPNNDSDELHSRRSFAKYPKECVLHSVFLKKTNIFQIMICI
jgi:hypothetical protein